MRREDVPEMPRGLPSYALVGGCVIYDDDRTDQQWRFRDGVLEQFIQYETWNDPKVDKRLRQEENRARIIASWGIFRTMI